MYSGSDKWKKAQSDFDLCRAEAEGKYISHKMTRFKRGLKELLESKGIEYSKLTICNYDGRLGITVGETTADDFYYPANIDDIVCIKRNPETWYERALMRPDTTCSQRAVLLDYAATQSMGGR